MATPRSHTVFVLAAFAAMTAALSGDDAASDRMFDLSKQKVLYCVGYAHLDTQWRWDFSTTIDKYIKSTLEENFDRFEKFPGYVFNFTGSVRYQMMKEYYPQHYQKLKEYIAAGRWCVSGSSVDEGDVNVPSAESVIRQVLYGNEFFRREFGKESVDFMLPDCFGFPASMPSVWAHCGLKGFSTQKLTWGSAMGIPFKIGVWEGLDGESVVAAFDPGAYVGAIEGRVDTNETWVKRVNENGRKYGVWADYHYYGVGDQGGAPREADVANYLASIDNADSQIKVALVSSDQMYKDITDEQRARLPRYRGDLLLTEHSAGTLTSQSYMKRWNRKNEILADAAERAAVAAEWLGGADYPTDKLNRSWERLLANQMHDILPGTSLPRAYRYSWNDEIIAANGFADVLHRSVGAIARAMDTRAAGTALAVYNPLAIDREDVVEATVSFEVAPPPAVRVFGPGGGEVASQILDRGDRSITVAFLAEVPSVSLSVFDVQPSLTACVDDGAVVVTANGLENESYRVTLNDDGDVASVIDKSDGRELLAAPSGLVFTRERPANWPAWNMDWADRQHPSIDRVSGPATVRVVERGPVRAAIEVRRKARNSIFTQKVRLSRGAASHSLEFVNEVDWQSTACALKASFPLKVANPTATYNWGMGTIARGNNEPTKYEVPSHEWFDLTDAGGEYGVTVLEDSKFGSDKPTDNEVRLTLLYTPGVRHSYLDQHSQDWGRHDFTYALYGHHGDWRRGRSEWQGRRLNQPLIPFVSTKHPGRLGKQFSLLRVSTSQVDVRALKRAENSEQTIVRVQELWGQTAEDVTVKFNAAVTDAFEVDGQERRIGSAEIKGGKLMFDLSPYKPRSFAVKTARPAREETPAPSTPIMLPFNADVLSTDADRRDGRLDREGRTIPAEMLPRELVSDGIRFTLGSGDPGRLNAIECKGQTITLPEGDFDRIYILAAAAEDSVGRFLLGDRPIDLAIQEWTGFVGQWDDRTWNTTFEEVDHQCDGKVTGVRRGFIKRDPIAWFCTHRHHPSAGNEAYKFSYIFRYAIDAVNGTRTLTLPTNDQIKVFAISVASEVNGAIIPAAALYDDFTDRREVAFRHVYPPPAPPVHEGAKALAPVTIDRQETFAALAIGPPSASDFADVRGGHGVLFEFFDGNGEYRPHGGSGIVGATLPRLNDGDVAQNSDDTKRCVWYDNGGRFYVDLGKSVEVERVNTYSWHRGNRAPQFFSLWGSNAETMPDPGVRHNDHQGWSLIGVVTTRDLGEGGVHGSSIGEANSGVGRYRYLLWAVEDVGLGTFFTEVDVHVSE